MECIREVNARHKVIIFCKSCPCNYQLDNNEIKQSNKETSMTSDQHDKWLHDYKAPWHITQGASFVKPSHSLQQ